MQILKRSAEKTRMLKRVNGGANRGRERFGVPSKTRLPIDDGGYSECGRSSSISLRPKRTERGQRERASEEAEAQ